MSGYVQTNQALLLPNSDYVISQADTGKILIIGAVTALRTITMPAPLAGLHYRFISSVASASDVRIVGPANSIFGMLENATTVTAVNGANLGINFVGGTSVKGDHLDMYCDGTGWSIIGISRIAGGLTSS